MPPRITIIPSSTTAGMRCAAKRARASVGSDPVLTLASGMAEQSTFKASDNRKLSRREFVSGGESTYAKVQS